MQSGTLAEYDEPEAEEEEESLREEEDEEERRQRWRGGRCVVILQFLKIQMVGG